MKSITVLISAWILLVTPCFAQSACTGQQYNDLPGFPAKQSGCYPTTYYRTSDLGTTSPDDARSRCQQQCTADSQCSSVVAQVNRAADTNTYPSGTCFFYNRASTPAGPRRCADTAYLLLGYKKDSTNACFSSSSASAFKYCSSYLGIPAVTVTNTVTPAVSTVTVTATTNPTTTTTNTISAIATSTKTVTTTISVTAIASTSTTTMTSNPTVTVTASSSTATTSTTTTVTSTTTVNSTRMSKRAVSSVLAPSCVSSDTPATRLSAACSCLSVSTSTVTTSTTLVAVTNTATTTTTIISTQTNSITVTSTTFTVTVIQSATTTVNPPPVTSTTTVTQTSTAVVTPAPTTTTVTSTSTVTSTTTSVFPGPRPCSPAGQYSTDCRPGCFCDYHVGFGNGVCDSQIGCGKSCNGDADCPPGSVCVSADLFTEQCGGNSCAPYTECV